MDYCEKDFKKYFQYDEDTLKTNIYGPIPNWRVKDWNDGLYYKITNYWNCKKCYFVVANRLTYGIWQVTYGDYSENEAPKQRFYYSLADIVWCKSKKKTIVKNTAPSVWNDIKELMAQDLIIYDVIYYIYIQIFILHNQIVS